MNFIKTINLKITACICATLLITSGAFAQDKEEKRIETATVALADFGKMKESIPSELLAVTNGIIVVPKLINAGFVVGGKRGRGIAMVKKADGSWSNPVFVTITGGSFGLQIGVQSVELVLVFKHATSLTDIKKSSFTLGGDLSVAAGPVGRSSSANTDYKLDAEVYSYSRSKGLFAGLSLNGAALAVDTAANTAFYGKEMSANTIFNAENSSDAKVKELKETLSLMK